MNIKKLEELTKVTKPYTALLYCVPGGGKSTAVGIIGSQSEGKTLVIDVDKTFVNAMKNKEIPTDFSKIDVVEIDNSFRIENKQTKEVERVGTWKDWESVLLELSTAKKNGTLEYSTIAVDNISELERCLLSDLGYQGKNNGVPSQADYQYVQFKLVNSLRFLKELGVNIIWTAWEMVEQFQDPDGSGYTMFYPKISRKIVDNICGLCDIVGRIMVKGDGENMRRGIVLQPLPNVYAKNQIDNRKGCKVEEFLKWEVK